MSPTTGSPLSYNGKEMTSVTRSCSRYLRFMLRMRLSLSSVTEMDASSTLSCTSAAATATRITASVSSVAFVSTWFTSTATLTASLSFIVRRGVRVDDLLHEPVPYHVFGIEVDRFDAIDVLEDALDLEQAGVFTARQID